MPPTLVLIRHAQALHNETKDYFLPDPELTALGRSQCQKLAERLEKTLPSNLDVDLIIVSPMRRCLETALLSLDFLINGKKVPIVAHAGWQENSAKPCDTGSPLASIAPDFPSVDFSQVDPVFPDKTSPAGAHYFYTRKALLGRAQACLRELHARPEKVIAVVSHSGFMRTSVTGCYYMNADYRIFDYAERSPEDEAGEIPFVLVQREETKASGGGMGTSWTDEVVLGDGLPDEDGAFNHGAPN